jgi:hypothetical protein
VAREERLLYGLLLLVLAGCIATGFALQGFSATLRGLWELQLRPGRLLIDFTSAAGEGAALVNAALAAAIGLALVPLSRVRLSGPTVAGVLTILGFGLFGKTPMNILPIVFGVFLSARLARRRFNEYLLMAMFGTALGPLVTMLAVETIASPALGLLIGVAGGIAAGMLLPPLALVMLRLHQGFSLYNIGLTAGFLGLLVAAIVSGARGTLEMSELWNANPSPVLRLMIPVLCAMCIAWGTALAPRAAWKGQLKIMRLSGRLPTDFMSMVGVAAGLVNMGLLGMAAWLYVLLVRGPFNGPVLGAILTVMGFAAFGKHPRNTWPILGGVVGSTLLFGRDLAAPGPLLAALFGTTLAPIAGEFGPVAGLVAGFLHLAMVERTGAWHLGMNLYNNGFAGGLTATYLVAVIEWYRSSRGGRRGAPPRQPPQKGEGSP